MTIAIQKSPLTYPYDRPRVGTLLSEYIPTGTANIITPFLGGGSLELSLAHRGYRVTGCTDFRLLYDFWKCVQTDPERVYEMAKNFHPFEDSKLFYALQKKVYQPHDEFLRSAIFCVLNLCTIEGTATSGVLEKNTPRFNDLRLMQLAQYACENFQVRFSHYEETISATAELANTYLIAAPPPLILGGMPAAVTVPEKPQIDHMKLFELLSSRNNWLLLYDYHEKLSKLYKDHKIILLNDGYRVVTNPQKATGALIVGS